MTGRTPRTTFTIAAIFLIAAIGFIIYGNSLKGGFIWDDKHLIKNNAYIRDCKYLPNLFKEGILAGAAQKDTFYRPIQMVSYMFDYSVWKLDVAGYHLTNIILHILAALCLFRLLDAIFKDNILSLGVSALFLTHPVHTEAIAYMSGRSDPLGFIFMMITFVLYLKYNETDRVAFYVGMAISYALALLSRENSVILPALLLVYHCVYRRKIKIKSFAFFAAALVSYGFLRAAIFKSSSYGVPIPTTAVERLPGFFAAVSDYLKLLVFPTGLHMEYGMKIFSFGEPNVLSGMIITAPALLYAFMAMRKRPAVSFGIFWFFVALLPVSNIFPINAYMAEHWLYVPCVGFFLIIADILKSLYNKRGSRIFSVSIFMAVIAVNSYLTVRQNNYWHDPISFYERTIRYAPDSWRSYSSLASEYFELGKRKELIPLYEKAIELAPTDAGAYSNLGLVYADLGEREKAVSLYKKAIELDPGRPDAYSNMGILYYEMGKREEAIGLFGKAIGINPRDSGVYNNIGVAYQYAGKSDEALKAFKKALELDPNDRGVYLNIAAVYAESGKNEEAVSSYKKAIELDPRFADAYLNLGILYHRLGKKNEAIALFRKALEIEPENAGAYNNLGVVYQYDGKFDEAIAAFKKAAALDPKDPKTFTNIAFSYYSMSRYGLAIENYDKAVSLGSSGDPALAKLLEPHRPKSAIPK